MTEEIAAKASELLKYRAELSTSLEELTNPENEICMAYRPKSYSYTSGPYKIRNIDNNLIGQLIEMAKDYIKIKIENVNFELKSLNC